MPGMNGFEVMEGLKDIEKDDYLPVLAITAQPDHKLRALRAGAKDFISKPFDLAEVLTRVHNMLEVRLLLLESKKANHLKDEFLAMVSHELRTPLNAILGWAQMLGAKQLPADRAAHAVSVIERNAVVLAHLIDDLLDVSRVVTGVLQLAPQPVDLAAVAQAALDTVRPLAVAKNVQLVFSPNLLATETVSGDAGRLQQVIWNLLANAIKFTPEGGASVSSSHPRTTTWRSGSSIPAKASASPFCPTCLSVSARPTARRRGVTPDWARTDDRSATRRTARGNRARGQ